MDDKKIQVFMQEFGGDWVKWKRNPPVASHMGGVWKKQICSAWRILFSLLQTHGKAFRWRRIQYVTNEFWLHWRKEFLQLPQERKKWQDKKRNFQSGNIVLLRDGNLIRNKWPMAKIVEMFKDGNGDVRSVHLKVG